MHIPVAVIPAPRVLSKITAECGHVSNLWGRDLGSGLLQAGEDSLQAGMMLDFSHGDIGPYGPHLFSRFNLVEAGNGLDVDQRLGLHDILLHLPEQINAATEITAPVHHQLHSTGGGRSGQILKRFHEFVEQESALSR